MTTCRWCGVELNGARTPIRMWLGRAECGSPQECEKRRVQRQVQVALERRAD